MSVKWSPSANSKKEAIEDQYDDDDEYNGTNKVASFLNALDDADKRISDPLVTRQEVPPGSGVYEYIDKKAGLTFYYTHVSATERLIVAIFVDKEDNPYRKKS